MYAFITFVSQCRSKAALCSGAALLLTACGGNVEQPAAQQSLALVATSQASDPQPTPDTAVAGVPVDGATGKSGPSTAEELFKANREQAYGPAADQQAAPEPAPSTQPAEAPGTPAG